MNKALLLLAVSFIGLSLCACDRQARHHNAANTRPASITDTSAQWPSQALILRTLGLRDHNTRVVVVGTTLLGLAAGVIGSFAYLRKRAMMGDALSHATMPGVALAFLLLGSKSHMWLVLGAASSGVLGMLSVIALSRFSRLKEDAAIGIVLSVFFAAGMVLFSLVQNMGTGAEAGLETFIYGKAAAMLQSDAYLIAAVSAMVLVACTLLFKEFRLVCFDVQFAASSGLPVTLLDVGMMSLVVLVTVIGLQAVGLILIVALLIIPPAAARFWTDRLNIMVWLAALIGALSGWLGSTFSALLPRLPTGGIIVLTAGVFFVASMLFSPHRGLLAASLRRTLLSRKVSYQNLMRALAEFEEQRGEGTLVTVRALLHHRSWRPRVLRQVLRRAIGRGDVAPAPSGQSALTVQGRPEARRILRNHRLWEMYLIKYADIAPSHVDRDADEVEHVLPGHVITELEQALAEEAPIPPSPHLQQVRT